MAPSARAAPLAHRVKSHGVLTPSEWAQIFAEESRSLGVRMTPKEIAEGIGILEYESSGNASNFVQGAGGHIGALAESPTFGSTKERLDPRGAVRAGIKEWKADGKSWWPAWGRWQEEQRPDGQAGSSQWKKYVGLVEHALGGVGKAPAAPGVAQQPAAAIAGGSSSGGLADDLMHVGLVAALVIGGAGMVGVGVTRVFGTVRKGAPA